MEKIKPNYGKSIALAIIILLLIFTIFCVVKCERTYSVYSENYRDTVYVDRPEPEFKKHCMKGFPDGIVQSAYDDDDGYYFIIRKIENSALDTIKVGYYDWNHIGKGDTISNNIKYNKIDTIVIRDTIHIENNNGLHKAYTFTGVPTGIVVEKGYLMNNDIDDNEYIRHSCVITLRLLDNSQLWDIKVGIHDYERLNLGDTIYGNIHGVPLNFNKSNKKHKNQTNNKKYNIGTNAAVDNYVLLPGLNTEFDIMYK